MGIEGNLTSEEMCDIYTLFNIRPSVLIETGTFQGDSIEAVNSLFEEIHTIEIDEGRYLAAKSRLEKYQNIHCNLGSSTDILPSIIELCRQKSCAWFLDAHSSGDVKVPLMDEIELILRGIEKPQLFIIDDVRLFDKHWDWSGVSVQTIKALISKHRVIKEMAIRKDRLLISVL